MRSLLLLFLLLCPALAAAEIAPEYYAKDQRRAPEALTVKVLDVDTSVCWFNACDARDVTAKVQVVTVERTATGLKPGATLTVKYQRTNMKGRSGPRPVDLLVEGQTVPAFIEKAGAHYTTAARGASFEPLIPLPKRPEAR